MMTGKQFYRWVLAGLAVSMTGLECAALGSPAFLLDGHPQMSSGLSELLALHLPGARTRCTLWDPWLPMSTLWAATGNPPSAREARDFYRDVLMRRPIDAEGYVSMQQHRGMAHSEGWPFPAWQQSSGMGWHFSLNGDGWAVQHFRSKALESADGWGVVGAAIERIDATEGLRLKALGDEIVLTTPEFSCGTVVAPFIRLEWSGEGWRDGRPSMEWLFNGEQEWPASRRVEFSPPELSREWVFSNVAMHRHPAYQGQLSRIRLRVPVAPGARVSLKSLITAIDTRHPITNNVFIQAAVDYFTWTDDHDFLRGRLGEIRRAMRFVVNEFQVRTGHHVRVPWVGHEGRSGLARSQSGRRLLRPGVGVGNNYWDLLPFGGHDAYATMQLYAAMRRLAVLEQEVAAHPEWNMERQSGDFSAQDLESLADATRTDFQSRFWNAETGRFLGWIDLDGVKNDYGFTFLNTEAIHHGLASPLQEKMIFEWLDGRRIVEGDTSQGSDIFHWRFGPRSTTRRNTETYVWVWSAPENISWGDQVQDGGAVLGFTYYELMARLRAQGADAAWRRLQEVADWFAEVQKEGGYRAYYAKPGRGSLQGGGPPGGLGFDHEFMESVLVPQVILYGFMGAVPRPGGLSLAPRLPAACPSMSIDAVHIQDHIFRIRVEPAAVEMDCLGSGDAEFSLWLPGGIWEIATATVGTTELPEPGTSGARHEFAPGGAPWRMRWASGQKRRFRKL